MHFNFSGTCILSSDNNDNDEEHILWRENLYSCYWYLSLYFSASSQKETEKRPGVRKLSSVATGQHQNRPTISTHNSIISNPMYFSCGDASIHFRSLPFFHCLRGHDNVAEA